MVPARWSKPSYVQADPRMTGGELRRLRHQPEDQLSMAPSLPRLDPAQLPMGVLEVEGLRGLLAEPV